METPLTERDLERINADLKEIQDAERLIDQAVRAGLDLGELPARLRGQKEQLLRIKNVFFPGQ